MLSCSTARKIVIREAPLPIELQLVSGSLSGEIAAISPGETLSWQYTVIPTSAGHFVAPACSVSYLADSDEDTTQVATVL